MGRKPILEYTSSGAIVGKNVYGHGIDEILVRTDYVAKRSGLTYYYQGSVGERFLSLDEPTIRREWPTLKKE